MRERERERERGGGERERERAGETKGADMVSSAHSALRPHVFLWFREGVGPSLLLAVG